jgi:NTE family protein
VKKIGLVLSGGGVRGAAHVGVIYNLQWLGIPLHIVSGTSIGAVIGAVYCAGISLDKLKNLIESLSLFKIFNPVFPAYGFSGFKKIRELFDKLGIPKDFKDLKIPLIVATTNLTERKTEYFNNGDLWEVLCASIAMPGFFYPVKIGNKIYVDGGISMNLPVSVIKDEDNFVIAVDVNFYGRRFSELENIYQIVYESLTFMVAKNTIDERAKADFIVDIPIDGIGFLDFGKIKDVITIGYRRTYDKILELKKLLEAKGYVQDRGLGPLFVSSLPEKL